MGSSAEEAITEGPFGKYWQPTAGFMASVTCWLTAEDWDQLQTTTLVSSTSLSLRFDVNFLK